MQGKLHVLVGIPGTRVRKSLERFAQFASRQSGGMPCQHVSVEEKLLEIASESEVVSDLALDGSNLVSLLMAPQELLRELWRKAFESAWGEVEAKLKQGNVILTLHLCYFHHLTREYVVPADFVLMRERFSGWDNGGQATAFVTLIDDIYDCQHHLSGAGGRFRPAKSADEAILQALSVLDWRSIEILLADQLAETCGLRNYLFAVKHTLGTLYDLLYTDKQRVYLSHPISEPRRLLRAQQRGEALVVVQGLSRVLSRLEKKFVVFEPTTIDELRFSYVGGSPTGNLELRWPFDADRRELFYISPTPMLRNAFVFPTGWEEDRRTDIPSSPLVAELHEAIKLQVNARDHHLVEQSDLIVCSRPFFNGARGGGVEEELEHAKRLMTAGVQRRPQRVVVHSPAVDREKYPYRHLSDEAIPAWRRRGELAGEDDAFDRFTAGIRSRQIKDIDAILSGGWQPFIAACREFGIEIVTPGSPGALDRSPEAEEIGKARILASAIRDAVTQTYLDRLVQGAQAEVFETEQDLFAALGV